MTSRIAIFRFYEELNDFLPAERRKKDFEYRYRRSPSVKDAIEAQGIPHVEVDLILANGKSVGFGYRLRDRDRISVFPEFESFDIAGLTHLRKRPLRDPSFILDVHLGRLAKYLRLLGLDTLYRNDFSRDEVITIAEQEKRIILTRDAKLLKMNVVKRGYAIRSDDPEEQTREVIRRFDLRSSLKPFSRCVRCNGFLDPVAKNDIADKLEELTRRHYDTFYRCSGCGKVYWEGSHFARMRQLIGKLTAPDESSHTD